MRFCNGKKFIPNVRSIFYETIVGRKRRIKTCITSKSSSNSVDESVRSLTLLLMRWKEGNFYLLRLELMTLNFFDKRGAVELQ